MNHAVKEQIKDNTLYVEVETQPPEWVVRFRLFNADNNRWVAHDANGNMPNWFEIKSPISIGDTVYQGREWAWADDYCDQPEIGPIRSAYLYTHILDAELKLINDCVHPPQTMPIELADKTFKVTGIEVKLKDSKPYMPQCFAPKAWFWKYSLEEIK